MQFYQVKRQWRHKKRRKSKGNKSLTCVPLPHYHSATSADQANWWKFKYCIVGRHNKFWVLLDNFIQSQSPIWRLSTHIITFVSQSPSCRIKRQEYYPETARVCGARPGGWDPSLCWIPDKLLSPCRVSSSHQLDSLWPGTIYNLYSYLFTIKIFTILFTISCTINKN